MTSRFQYLDILLHLHRNKYEHPKEQLIILVHWTFLSRDFRLVKNDEVSNRCFDEFYKTMDLTRNDKDSIDIDYFGKNLVIHIEQYFDNENFFIQFKTDQNNQLHLQMPVNSYINENDGSLKDVEEFIATIGNEIYELIERKKEMDKNKEKELQQQQQQQQMQY